MRCASTLNLENLIPAWRSHLPGLSPAACLRVGYTLKDTLDTLKKRAKVEL
jgi:hypothetical protein